MPLPTPFHLRTSALCRSYRWKDWAGYYAVCGYGDCHEREYFAFRHSAGLMDVTPLHKYEVRGPDAADFLARVMARDIRRLKRDQVTYCCWCDDDGKLLDDGTVARLDEAHYRVTAAEPNLAWFRRNSRGFEVTVEDSTDVIAALSLQGPNSREILRQVTNSDIEALRFFRLTQATIGADDVIITRTGYSGDLGYEIWMGNRSAVRVWDALIEAGKPFRLEPVGLDALDMCRVEAGFIMNGVDYFSANHCLIESRKSTPLEAGLGWTVHLDRDGFVGQAALSEEQDRGPSRQFVGLVYDWDEYEALFAERRLPPEVSAHAWRDPVPVYTEEGVQVGQATSGSWSPVLKRNLALATIDGALAAEGTRLRIEVTVEYERRTVGAMVTPKPFFDPPRKKG